MERAAACSIWSRIVRPGMKSVCQSNTFAPRLSRYRLIASAVVSRLTGIAQEHVPPLIQQVFPVLEGHAELLGVKPANVRIGSNSPTYPLKFMSKTTRRSTLRCTNTSVGRPRDSRQGSLVMVEFGGSRPVLACPSPKGPPRHPEIQPPRRTACAISSASRGFQALAEASPGLPLGLVNISGV